MNKLFLICVFSLAAGAASAQIGSVPATLNQIKEDPAVDEVGSDLQKLRKTVNDLDEPKKEEPTTKRPRSGKAKNSK